MPGAFQGTLSGIQGGGFWVGLASGALASIASSAFTGPSSGKGLGGKFAKSTPGIIAFGTVAGAGGAALTKGNIWQGAAIGLVVSGLNHVAHQDDPPTKRERMAERLGRRYQRNENRILAESLVAEALLETTEPGELLTGFRENFNKEYGNQKSQDINEVYSTGIGVIKNLKDSFGGGKITDAMIFKASAALAIDILYLHAENSSLSISIQYLGKNSYYKFVNPGAKPQRGGFSGAGVRGIW